MENGNDIMIDDPKGGTMGLPLGFLCHSLRDPPQDPQVIFYQRRSSSHRTFPQPCPWESMQRVTRARREAQRASAHGGGDASRYDKTRQSYASVGYIS